MKKIEDKEMEAIDLLENYPSEVSRMVRVKYKMPKKVAIMTFIAAIGCIFTSIFASTVSFKASAKEFKRAEDYQALLKSQPTIVQSYEDEITAIEEKWGDRLYNIENVEDLNEQEMKEMVNDFRRIQVLRYEMDRYFAETESQNHYLEKQYNNAIKKGERFKGQGIMMAGYSGVVGISAIAIAAMEYFKNKKKKKEISEEKISEEEIPVLQ